MIRVLFVCTANQCRSPLAEVLMGRALEGRGCGVEVASAGFAPGGVAVPAPVLDVAADLALGWQQALRAHRSRQLFPDLVAGSDLVVTMTRQHLVDLLGLVPDRWQHCFTVTDLLARARRAGAVGDDPGAWVAALDGGRSAASLLRLPLADDVVDPVGRRRSAFVATRRLLEEATVELADLLCPPPAT